MTATPVTQAQALAALARLGNASEVDANDYTLANLRSDVEVIGAFINAHPAAPGVQAAPASGSRLSQVGDRLWAEFMDLCAKRGVAPATQDDLFAIVPRIRAFAEPRPTSGEPASAEGGE